VDLEEAGQAPQLKASGDQVCLGICRQALVSLCHARLGKTYQIRGGRRQDKNDADDLRERTSFSERSEDVEDLGIDHGSQPSAAICGRWQRCCAAALALSPAASAVSESP
jgi:hypothetical protein